MRISVYKKNKKYYLLSHSCKGELRKNIPKLHQ